MFAVYHMSLSLIGPLQVAFQVIQYVEAAMVPVGERDHSESANHCTRREAHRTKASNVVKGAHAKGSSHFLSLSHQNICIATVIHLLLWRVWRVISSFHANAEYTC